MTQYNSHSDSAIVIATQCYSHGNMLCRHSKQDNSHRDIKTTDLLNKQITSIIEESSSSLWFVVSPREASVGKC